VNVGEEIGIFRPETPMGLIRRLLLFHRPFTRVLYRQCADDDQHFPYTAERLRGDKHPSEARINRQLGELLTDGRKLIAAVDCLKFFQQFEAVTDKAMVRAIDKWKFVNITHP